MRSKRNLVPRAFVRAGTAIAVLMLGGAIGGWLAGARADEIPSDPSMYYSGRVMEDGVPLATATLRVTVALWTDPISVDEDNRACATVDPDVRVVDGYFRVALHADCEQAVRHNSELFTEVTIESDPPLPRTRLGASPYAVVAGNGVPVGTVIDWWQPPGALVSIPDGFALCDGRTLSDPASRLNGQALPDLRDRFVLGVASLARMGEIGGSIAHDHSIPEGGLHTHRQTGGTIRATTSGDYYAAERNWSTTETGLHDHGGLTGATDSLPPYVGLLKIIRVR
jgi:hypothetical protein